MVLDIVHFDLVGRQEIGEVELFDKRCRGIKPLNDEGVLLLGHRKLYYNYTIKTVISTISDLSQKQA